MVPKAGNIIGHQEGLEQVTGTEEVPERFLPHTYSTANFLCFGKP